MTRKMTAAHPHRIANEKGDYYTTHAGYVEWLRYCAGLWRDRGDATEQSRIEALADINVKRGAKHCPVCKFAATGGKTRPELSFWPR